MNHIPPVILLFSLLGCGLLDNTNEAIQEDAADRVVEDVLRDAAEARADDSSIRGDSAEPDQRASSGPTEPTTTDGASRGGGRGAPCASETDCGEGTQCEAGVCRAEACDDASECGAWQTCDQSQCAPDPERCSGFTGGALQGFGGACCYTSSSHPTNPSCVWYGEPYLEGEGQCLDAQCDSGVCGAGRYCTKSCTVSGDALINATGDLGSDGVTDPTEPDPCRDDAAVDGLYGSSFRCVDTYPSSDEPRGLCRPGTTFGHCQHDGECPQGEICGLLYVKGETEKRCVTPVKGGAALGEPCNDDPNLGALTRCEGPLCYGFGCTSSCQTDDHCSSVSCLDGACATDLSRSCSSDADCGAMVCKALTPFSNAEFTDTFCWPKSCQAIGDCVDPGWHCRPFWNGADTVEDATVAPACRKNDVGAARYGEPCGVEGDGSGLPECVYPDGCIDNICSGPCRSDADCPDDLSCLRQIEWSIDVQEDGLIDTYLDVDLCVPWPDAVSQGSCTSDADCGLGSGCQYRVRSVPDATGQSHSRVEFACRDDDASNVGFGEACGGAYGGCATDLCLGSSHQEEVPSMCSQTCGQALDCPDLFDFDGYTWKSICLSLKVGHNNTPEEEDDLYVPYCWRASAIASLQPCNNERQCAGVKEYCRALPIATNPSEPTLVEHLCLDQASGLEAYPTKDVGEACSDWWECKGRQCLSDGNGGGYCSALCGSDAACVNPDGVGLLRCTTQTLIPRADASLAGTTRRCVKAETCLSCSSDEDCGGDFRCVNMGGLGELADYRCGAPCDLNSDCEQPDHTCIEHVTASGAPTNLKACMPLSCD